MIGSTSTEAEPATQHTSTSPRRDAVLPWLRAAVRVGLGGIWIVAGALKVADPAQSVTAVAAYRLMPTSLAHLVGWGLPFAEVVLGLLLMAGLFTRWSAVASGGLQLIMLAGLMSAWARGLSIDCGCFSGGGEVAPGATAYLGSLIRDIIFFLAAVWLIWQPRTRLSLDAVTGGLDLIDEEAE
jgi:uncharacterized membrane protein YphA (DoxX/SURF4 family)